MRKIRLILAEDDSDHQRLLLMALAAGRPMVDVVIVGGREQLLAAARERTPDCIVLDYNLPPHSAKELVPELRELLPETPIVVVSSSAEQEVVIASLRIGVADFVNKERALQGDELWRRIEAAVNRSRSERRALRGRDRRLEALRRDAVTDALTGLFNRRYASRVLNSGRARGDRRGDACCIMADVDHFKTINDRWGHAAGDLVLREIGRVLREEADGADSLIRWGGEEFLIIKPGQRVAAGFAWAERVRTRLAGVRLAAPGGEVGFTLSFGVAGASADRLSEETVAAADRALYLAKDEGRNRTCTAAMAAAMETAAGVEALPALEPAERAREFLRRMGPALGPVQAEHVGPHGRRVAQAAEQLGRAMGLPSAALADLALAASCHDIGKVGIPEELLAGPCSLNDAERAMMDRHAGFGASLLRAMGLPERVARIVAAHHDRYQETAASGEAIERTLGHVVSVADALVSMMSDRPYATRRTRLQALAELRFERGRQFDPATVDVVQLLEGRGAVAA